MDWKMPDLGEGVQEGEVIKWLVKEGEPVALDQHLVEIMTDKATMEIPSSAEGVVQKILVREGEIAKVGQTMAVIGGEIGDRRPETRDQRLETGDKRPGRMTHDAPHMTGKALASPAVRRMARDLGIDLSKVHGSGPGGRVLAEDLKEKNKTHDAPRMTHDGEERIPLRGLRRKIAEHMTLSRKTAAHFTHVDEADLTELVLLREKAKKGAEAKGVKLSYLPYILQAVIHGLKKFPQMNASLDDSAQEVILKRYYNIGVAVATDQGLIVPVVKNADRLELFALAKEIYRLGEAAREGKIALEDLKGGTFTVTNIGSIGGVLSAPIINYPEVAIMGLHQIKPRPMVIDGKVAIRQMMYITLSADHRVVDGAEAARFLKEVITMLERPSGEIQ